jgi:hypothetical protein
VDDCRFDNWTRLVATSDRRTAVRGIAGSMAALALLARANLGLAEDTVVLEANCKGTGGKCKQNKQCCSKKCNKKGKCVCAGAGAGCKRDNGCCSGKCKGTQCVCGDKGDLCKNDSDCCSKDCANGHCRCVKQGNRCNDNKVCCSGSCNSSGFCD